MPSNRLKNIEETEKAKRALFERQQAEANIKVSKEAIEADNFAAERFYKAAPLPQANKPTYANNTNLSDAETLKLAREAAARGEIDGWEERKGGAGNAAHMRQTASDDVVMARFRQRQAQNNKKVIIRR